MLARRRIKNDYPTFTETSQNSEPEKIFQLSNREKLSGMIQQIGLLNEYAGEVFSNIYEESAKTLLKLESIQQRTDSLKKDIIPDVLHYFDQEGALEKLNQNKRVIWKSQVVTRSDLISPGSMPEGLKEVYEDCHSPPNFDELDKYNNGSDRCIKLYSNPGFFIEEWIRVQQQKVIEMEKEKKKRRKKRLRIKTEGTPLNGDDGPEIRVKTDTWNKRSAHVLVPLNTSSRKDEEEYLSSLVKRKSGRRNKSPRNVSTSDYKTDVPSYDEKKDEPTTEYYNSPEDDSHDDEEQRSKSTPQIVVQGTDLDTPLLTPSRPPPPPPPPVNKSLNVGNKLLQSLDDELSLGHNVRKFDTTESSDSIVVDFKAPPNNPPPPPPPSRKPDMMLTEIPEENESRPPSIAPPAPPPPPPPEIFRDSPLVSRNVNRTTRKKGKSTLEKVATPSPATSGGSILDQIKTGITLKNVQKEVVEEKKNYEDDNSVAAILARRMAIAPHSSESESFSDWSGDWSETSES